jgi:hypothetical protein
VASAFVSGVDASEEESHSFFLLFPEFGHSLSVSVSPAGIKMVVHNGFSSPLNPLQILSWAIGLFNLLAVAFAFCPIAFLRIEWAVI